MERYRLKNIIILILALVNLFLLGSIIQRHSAQLSSRRIAAEQLSALFFADGMQLEPDCIPQEIPPDSLNLSRDPQLEDRAAALLLGQSNSESDQGGGIRTYKAQHGTALFRSNGSFEASGTLGTEDSMAFCQEFSHRFGFAEPEFVLDEHGSGTAQAQALWDDLPVLNSSIQFTFNNGQLVGVEGVLLPKHSAPLLTEEQPLSALAALGNFQKAKRETGAVVTAISDISLCYELQSSTTLPLVLVPAWCIDSNTAKYYVNAITGVVRLP